MKLQGRIAIITGGSSGIGRATALLFAREGATVVLAARTSETAADVVGEILGHSEGAAGHGTPGIRTGNREGGSQEYFRGGDRGPRRALFVPTDVTSPEQCESTVARVLDAYGRLDILVNNAGIILRERTVVDTTPEEWDLTFHVNVRGTFLMSRAAIPALEGGGVIVNNASYLGLVGARGVAAYAAAKGAVVNLTRAMALDHAAAGIRVNCVAPGSVETPMLHQEWTEMGGEDSVRHLFEEKHPLGRISQPGEIAKAILFLASDEASFITGACLPVDGGLTAG